MKFIYLTCLLLCGLISEVCSTPTQTDDSENLLANRNICGIQSDDKPIVDIPALDQFPWMAILEYENIRENNKREFHCSGVLINNKFVLTAAHCIMNIPPWLKLKSVRLGEHTLNKEKDCQTNTSGSEKCADPPVVVDVAQTIVHDKYDPAVLSRRHDIALLQLQKEISFSNFIKPVCVPLSPDFDNSEYNKSKQATVIGWGMPVFDTQNHTKQRTEVVLVSPLECSRIYREKLQVSTSASHLCIRGVGNANFCKGDTGGPLMVADVAGAKKNWIAIGISSYSAGCQGEFPGVYTRISSYSDWIIDNIQ
ncbi:hypothetical protein ILUMI_09449 [Ignelater luminosus]|uniref:Peptidase S1 domain-containing protein n=1 Tax=Ignelater luminosus TaxID=2038154 RepID=A0A8K0D3U4_IGNLU|nr:hypothetical protein ILUMI_09449 [Ignelater luminosus]